MRSEDENIGTNALSDEVLEQVAGGAEPEDKNAAIWQTVNTLTYINDRLEDLMRNDGTYGLYGYRYIKRAINSNGYAIKILADRAENDFCQRALEHIEMAAGSLDDLPADEIVRQLSEKERQAKDALQRICVPGSRS